METNKRLYGEDVKFDHFMYYCMILKCDSVAATDHWNICLFPHYSVKVIVYILIALGAKRPIFAWGKMVQCTILPSELLWYSHAFRSNIITYLKNIACTIVPYSLSWLCCFFCFFVAMFSLVNYKIANFSLAVFRALKASEIYVSFNYSLKLKSTPKPQTVTIREMCQATCQTNGAF